MNLLAVDTSTRSCSVALLSGDRLLSETTVTDGKTHSVHLLPMIHDLLKGCRWVLADLNAIAVTRGPGTFTGLRIGISTVKGLAAAARIPVVGVGSLAALAWPHLGQGRAVAALIDAPPETASDARNPARCGPAHPARRRSPAGCSTRCRGPSGSPGSPGCG